MDVAARVTSKGQITVPKAVRDVLDLHEGDQVLFRIKGKQVLMAATEDLLELRGSIPVPAEVKGLSWDEIRERAWTTPDEDEEAE